MDTAAFATFLGLAGFLVGLVGALLSLYFVRRRMTAEREMARTLTGLLYEHEKLRATIGRFDLDAESMAGLLEEATNRLAESERAMVLRALRQPSEQGRKAYVRKLIREAQVANAG